MEVNTKTKSDRPPRGIFVAATVVGAFILPSPWTIIGPARNGPIVQPPAVFSHQLLDSLLATRVDDSGRVDYTALAREPDLLDGYYRLVAAYSPDSHPALFPDESSRLAYWINAYNAAVLKAVVTYYPIASVSDVKPPTLLFFLSDKSGFFYFQKLVFGGESMNLYNLEHDLIRPRFLDPRVHFALNCASGGCPRLPQRAFSAAALEAELDREARVFVNEDRNLRIDHGEKAIFISSIFSWYESDFVDWLRSEHPGEEPSLLAYARRYLAPPKLCDLERASDYELRVIPYDWSLNDQKFDRRSGSGG